MSASPFGLYPRACRSGIALLARRFTIEHADDQQKI
jgi:hypothetical protein